MAKDIQSIPSYKPTRDEIKNIKEVCMGYGWLAYKKRKSTYRVYCATCDTYKTISKREMREVIASRKCPNCFQEVKTQRKLEKNLYQHIIIRKDDEDFGYLVTGKWEFEKKPKLDVVKQIYYSDGKKEYRKDILKNMSGSLSNVDTKGWKKCATVYSWLFTKVLWFNERKERFYKHINTTKKMFYEWELSIIGDYMKSNQKKIVMDGLYNINQVSYMVLFDLKSREEILKHTPYMRDNNISGEVNKPYRLNKFYLEYLVKNNISCRDFLDYADECYVLGIKIEKPKNFQEKHMEVHNQIVVKKNKEKEKKIKKVYKKLNKYSMEKGVYIIKPFESMDEIITAGDKLNNCLSSYITDYSKGRTTLWHIDKNGKIVGAIEVENKKVIQARAKNNRNLGSNEKRMVNEWVKMNGFQY